MQKMENEEAGKSRWKSFREGGGGGGGEGERKFEAGVVGGC